ncbi:MAG TPA: hypothetical protein VHO48_12225, partial [Anaerolineaceae bacterium]|nr:hypothetical protein [Anaerolineaceae bacterium]
DLLISHYPNALFLKQMLVEWRQLPLWSSTILSGAPFAANPLSGIWYLPGWLVLPFPQPLGFNVVAILHLMWGGLGMYRWMRSERVGQVGALFAALAFEGMPKLWAHLAAGHVSLLYAVAWTPWLLWAEKRRADTDTRRLSPLGPGVLLGIIFLADPRWAAYAGILWLFYAAWQEWRKASTPGTNKFIDNLKSFVKNSPLVLVIQAGLAILIAAPLLLPLARYTQATTRSGLSTLDTLGLALPVENLLDLIVPNLGGYAEWIVYPTVVALLLASLTLVVPELRRKTGFWWLAILASLIFALGPAVPGAGALTQLPGMNLLRVPSRACFVTGIGFAVTAGYALDALTDPERRRWIITKKAVMVPAIIILAIALALVSAIGITQHNLPFNFTWAVAGSLLVFILIVLAIREVKSIRWVGLACLLLVIVDAGVVNRLSLDPRSVESVEAPYIDLAEYLAAQPGSFRVYSPSYSLPQNIAVKYGISLADGVDPLQLTSYVDFMANATGVASQGYSVTLPPFENGDPATDNVSAIPNPRLLGLLNVRYILADYDLPQMGLEMKARFGNTRVYMNPYANGAAWTQPETITWGQGARTVPAERIGANEVDLTVDGPSMLVLSEIAYSGWQVEVDGKRAEIIYGNPILGVLLEEGQHKVHFVFQPWDVPVGLGIALFAWAGLIGAQFFQNQNRKSNLQQKLSVQEQGIDSQDPLAE